jgi:hypothetical protein
LFLKIPGAFVTRESLESLIQRDEFRPFRIITTAGLGYDITDPGALALGKSELFYYFPRSDRSIHVPYAQIATIEETTAAKKR